MTNNTVTAVEARTNAAAVRVFWKTGRDSLRRLQKLNKTDAAALAHGNKSITYTAEAERMAMNIDQASKARRIGQQYNKSAIDTICTLVKQHLAPFGPTHLSILLRIEDRTKRDKVMLQAIQGAWSVTRVERAAQGMRGKRRPNVGRDPVIPDDPVEKLVALDALAGKFLNWCAHPKATLPAELQPIVAKAIKAVKQVQDAISEALKANVPAE